MTIEGVVQSDQVKSVDWTVREIEYVGAAPLEVVDEVVANVVSLIEE